MKRAARFKTGSVVFDKRRKTWNFLWWEGAKRRSTRVGSLQECPTKATAQRAAQSLQNKQTQVQPSNTGLLSVMTLVDQYRAEKMPDRYSTRRSYDA